MSLGYTLQLRANKSMMCCLQVHMGDSRSIVALHIWWDPDRSVSKPALAVLSRSRGTCGKHRDIYYIMDGACAGHLQPELGYIQAYLYGPCTPAQTCQRRWG